MSYFKFTKAILEGRPIEVFNHGNMQRDFTYVDDIVEGVLRVLERASRARPDFDAMNPDPATSSAPYRIYNLGSHRPVDLMTYINVLEQALGREAEKKLLPLQDGDVIATYAETSALQADFGFVPATSIKDGIRRFVDWYCSYYRVSPTN
jgi:UDP-glucuronate 4-epimerase